MINYKAIATEIRKKVLKMLYESQTSHLGSNMSCVEILTVLYFKIFDIQYNWLPVEPSQFVETHNVSLVVAEKMSRPIKERFILSKGHAVAALYATLVQRGMMPAELLNTYCQEGGLEGHPKRNIKYGIETSTGSLGHGLAMGAGMALIRENKVFVLLSDGECDEGSVWETAKFVSDNKLDNLIAIIDCNGWQAFKKTNTEFLADKWKAFGWEVREVDGHNCQDLETQLEKPPLKKGKPICIIAHTIKGKGVPSMEDKLESHYLNLTKEEYENSIV